jgi:aryl-alcohol dehydrogenase-like predicted oxidoreductase
MPVLDGPSIIAGAEAELRRLRTDYIDLLQLVRAGAWAIAGVRLDVPVCITPSCL